MFIIGAIAMSLGVLGFMTTSGFEPVDWQKIAASIEMAVVGALLVVASFTQPTREDYVLLSIGVLVIMACNALLVDLLVHLNKPGRALKLLTWGFGLCIGALLVAQSLGQQWV